MLGKWVIGIVVLIIIWAGLGAIMAIRFADTEMEKYSGVIALAIGILALIAILNREGRDYDDIDRIQREIDKRKKKIQQHEKAIKYYEKRKEEIENT